MSGERKKKSSKPPVSPERTITIEIVSGVEGPSIYVQDQRVAGNKPWGGGKLVKKWEIPFSKLERAINLVKR